MKSARVRAVLCASVAVVLLLVLVVTMVAVDEQRPIVYRTAVAGAPVVNPHKGFVMYTWNAPMFAEQYPYGDGGKFNNPAWKIVSVATGAHDWSRINPSAGTNGRKLMTF